MHVSVDLWLKNQKGLAGRGEMVHTRSSAAKRSRFLRRVIVSIGKFVGQSIGQPANQTAECDAPVSRQRVVEVLQLVVEGVPLERALEEVEGSIWTNLDEARVDTATASSPNGPPQGLGSNSPIQGL